MMAYVFLMVVAMVSAQTVNLDNLMSDSSPGSNSHLRYDSRYSHRVPRQQYGYGQPQGQNAFLQQMLIMKMLQRDLTQFQTDFNAAADDAAQVRAMKEYARKLLTVGRLLPEQTIGGYYPHSYSHNQLAMLSGGNPYIERLIMQKIIEDTIASSTTKISDQSGDLPAQVDEIKSYANTILLIGKIFGI